VPLVPAVPLVQSVQVTGAAWGEAVPSIVPSAMSRIVVERRMVTSRCVR
jgi:hypothetical protein